MPFADNQGVRIHYEMEGKGPPLVLQYGQYVPLEAWYEYNYVGALQDHFQLIMVDARGQGQSDKPHAPEAYRLGHTVKDILAVLDDLGLEKVHFMGYSSGGFLGFGIAKLASDRLHCLILGGCPPHVDPGWDGSWDLAQIAALEKQTALEFTEGLEGFVQSLGFPPFTPALKSAMLLFDTRALIAWHRNNLIGRELSFDEIVGSISVPCLLYSGENSGEFSEVQRAAQEIPGASFVGIPNGGHLEGGTWIHLLKPHILKVTGVA